jgi:nicotinate-nucleotide adenylyltransferase
VSTEPQRIAIFGGTFDPIHNAHLVVAREAAARFQLDRVLFVTSANPPHKVGETDTPYSHRHSMVEIACRNEPLFEPSRIEQGAGKSYTIRTIVKVMRSIRKEDHLYFLIGADAFAEIGTWHHSETLVKLVEFIVVTRPGHDYVTPAGARVLPLESVALPVSSSEIRQELAAGRVPRDLPDGVFEYIRANGLYDCLPVKLAESARCRR